MTQVYLIRHAEAEGNLYRRAHGWYNSLITPNGYRQIQALEARFRDIPVDAVYSSDRFRTMTTARAVYAPKGLPLQTSPHLREVHLGCWEDRPWGLLDREDRARLALFNATSPDWKVEDGESFEEVRQRLAGALRAIARENPGRTVAVFSHGVAIRNTLALFSGLSVAQSAGCGHSDNTAVSLLEFEGDQVRVVFRDDNSHLPPEISTLARQRWWREGGFAADANMWFRPMDLEKEGDVYLRARKEAWKTIHGTMRRYPGRAFLEDAMAHSRRDPSAVVCAMLGEEMAGILQMNLERDADQGIGHIPFYYMMPNTRGRGLGVQLLGQAVSTFRALGRDRLRLRCAPENHIAQRFYQRCGFYKVGEEPGGLGSLDTMEKYIGYEVTP